MTNHISDANKKAPLDELIESYRYAFFYSCDDDEREEQETMWRAIERMIRTAVEKHAEAVMPKPYGYLQHMSSKEQYDKGNGFSECIDEIKQKSDEFRGLS